MFDDVLRRVHAYILQHTLIAPGDTVIVAVSGGADSVCLLALLHALAPQLECRLHVAHLDHALRAASKADAASVATHAAALGLPCTLERRDVRALARERRLSLETAARAARYDFLRAVAAKEGATCIATGHTRDDQAETLLLHLARGSGLAGLAGMTPRRDGLIRPLLEISHAETLACCAALGLTPREDASNRSPAHRRNRLRHEVLPLLESIQPAAGANLARAARLLAVDLALIERLAARALARAVVESDGARVTLSVREWAQAPPELRPHVLRQLLSRLRGSAEGFDERAYERMLGALAPDASETRLSLPKRLVLERRGALAVLGPVPAPLAPLGCYQLPVPGAVETEAGRLRAEMATALRVWTDVPAHVAYLDPAACGAALLVRAWRPGDRLRPLGLGGTRKVQDIFVDRKIPRTMRRRVPIVEGTRGIAWVAGLCVSDEYRVETGAPARRLTWEQY